MPCFQWDRDISVTDEPGGMAYRAGVAGEKPQRSVRNKVKSEFCDYNAKYLADETQYFCRSDAQKRQQRAQNKDVLQGLKDRRREGIGVYYANHRCFQPLPGDLSSETIRRNPGTLTAKQAGDEFFEINEQ